MEKSDKEQELWRGHPTQLMAFKFYFGATVVAALLIAATVYVWILAQSEFWYVPMVLLVVLIIAVGIKYLLIRTTEYILTNERLVVKVGVFTRESEELELYRVRDWSVIKPFWLRLVDRGHVRLITTDASAPELTLKGITSPEAIREILRDNVEVARQKKRVRQIEFEGDMGSGEPV